MEMAEPVIERASSDARKRARLAISSGSTSPLMAAGSSITFSMTSDSLKRVVAGRVDDLGLALEDHAPRHEFVVADVYIRPVEVQRRVAYFARLLDPGDHQPGTSAVKEGEPWWKFPY
jgi:hypothetical protein